MIDPGGLANEQSIELREPGIVVPTDAFHAESRTVRGVGEALERALVRGWKRLARIDQQGQQYNDGQGFLALLGTNQSTSMELEGYGELRPANVTFSVPTHDFGASDLNTEYTKVITIVNSGQEGANLTFDGLESPFSISEDCPADLFHCDITVKYNPTVVGDHSDTLTMTYGDVTKSLSLSGSVSPVITSISPESSISDTSKSLIITGSNFGNATTVDIGGKNCFIHNRSATSIMCFLPEHTEGAKTVTLNDGYKSATTTFTYLGLPDISVDTLYSYGDVRAGYSADKTFTITSTGGSEVPQVIVSGLSLPNTPYSIKETDCGLDLAVGSTCTFVITFSPTQISDYQSDVVKIYYSDGKDVHIKNLTLDGDGIDSIVSVETGDTTSFAVYYSGKVKASGNNQNGRLGIDYVNIDYLSDWRDVNVTDVASISSGQHHTCALKKDHYSFEDDVWCWGMYDLYINNIPVDTGEKGIQVSAGVSITAVLKNDGSVRTIGAGTHGQLCNGTNDSFSTTFVDVSNTGPYGINVTQVAAGGEFILLLSDDGKVYGCGKNKNMEIGTTDTNATYNVPTQIAGLSNIVEVSANQGYGLARDNTGKVYMWGKGDNGLNGSDIFQDSATPVEILTSASKISAGALHASAILDDKTISLWGSASSGRLGNGQSGINDYQSTPVNHDLSVLDISAGGGYTLILTENGDLYAFGMGYFFGFPNVTYTTPTLINP